MSYEFSAYDEQDGVATLTLSSPEVMNALRWMVLISLSKRKRSLSGSPAARHWLTV